MNASRMRHPLERSRPRKRLRQRQLWIMNERAARDRAAWASNHRQRVAQRIDGERLAPRAERGLLMPFAKLRWR